MSGFTLLEILVVMAILAILAGIAVPRWGTLLPVFRLHSAVRQLHSEFGRIKMQAVSENTRFRLVFGTASYAIERREGGVYQPTGEERTLPEGIDIRSTTRTRLGFTPRGTATPGAGTVRLCNVNGAGSNVVVSSTGRIRICTPSGCNGSC